MNDKQIDKVREMVFIDTVRALMPVCGVSAIPEATKYFELMVERIMEDLETRKVGASLRKEETNEKKEIFIKTFLSLFEKTYGRKYTAEINIRELSVIGSINESLELEQIPIGYYLEWCFGEFLKEDFVDGIASIAMFGSQKVFMKFLITKKDAIEQFKQKQLAESDIVILRDLFKKCVREARELGPDGEVIISDMKVKGESFKSGYLHIDDFRKYVFDKQEMIKEMKKKVDTMQE